MSNDVIISVENLGKKYRIQHQGQGQRYTTLRDVIAHKLTTPWRWLREQRRPQDHGQQDRKTGFAAESPLSSSPVVRSPSSEDFWALKDVSFEVKQGEVLGIIGRNGAGKSTLLKILSRITEPTTGRIHIRGRVASLLEVGTGFHNELTGRENIFLNGAILGMHRAEIKRKFDEIVAFSEVEKFLDTPVKRYSSGMYVRLAFAVAAHLEPEILIVDEVLAVGDAQFQKKCLGKMEDVSKNKGRTVLFVSHNLQAVRHLCRSVLLLNQGKLKFAGDVNSGISHYTGASADSHQSSIDLRNYPRPVQSVSARLTKVNFLDEKGHPVFKAIRSSNLVVKADFEVGNPLAHLDIAMAIVHVDGQRVFSESYSDQFAKLELSPGEYSVRFTLPLRFLKLESYFLVVGLYDSGRHCDIVEALPLPELVDANCDPQLESQRWGYVRIPVQWFDVRLSSDANLDLKQNEKTTPVTL